MTTEQYLIVRNRLTGAVQFTADIICAPNTSLSVKMGLAVTWAIKTCADLAGACLAGADLAGANLRGADLRDADLGDADLGDADLGGANLGDADLAGANLAGANLASACLVGACLASANLVGANLRIANLVGANLGGANLRGANLRGANLRGANLWDADLVGADLGGANLGGAIGVTEAMLRPIKADMWKTLAHNPGEVAGLINALQEGRVDGSQYTGECACLVGTIANVAGVNYTTLPHNSESPAERWFASIKEGDKPGDRSAGGFASGKALVWAQEFHDLCPPRVVETASA